MRIIKITASQKALPVQLPYLFNIKEQAQIRMEKEDRLVPDTSEKRIVTCLLEPIYSEDSLMKTLSITYEGQVLWLHDYALHTRAEGKPIFISVGGIMSQDLSNICQAYRTVNNPELWSRKECERRFSGQPLLFPPCDDRSLVTIVEAGDIHYDGLQSVLIRRVDRDSRFCDITFA